MTAACSVHRARADCIWHDFWTPGDSPAVFAGTAEGELYASAVLMDRCEFYNNTSADGKFKDEEGSRGGVIFGNADAQIALRNWTFEGNHGPDAGIRDGSAVVYANPRMPVYMQVFDGFDAAKRIRAAAFFNYKIETPGVPFVNLTDPDFIRISKVCRH